MRGKVAKELRKMAYGDISLKNPREYVREGGVVWSTDHRRNYQGIKGVRKRLGVASWKRNSQAIRRILNTK